MRERYLAQGHPGSNPGYGEYPGKWWSTAAGLEPAPLQSPDHVSADWATAEAAAGDEVVFTVVSGTFAAEASEHVRT